MTAMPKSVAEPKCMDVQSWRSFTKEEMLVYLGKHKTRSDKKLKIPSKKITSLAIRQHLSPVDVYCYLKARFGEPNGIQNLLRGDTSDNLIHWDYNLKAGDEDVYICGMSREIHIRLSGYLTDENWRDLILKIRNDYKRLGQEKQEIQSSLEKWAIFPNKFVEIASICAELHGDIVDNMEGFRVYKKSSTKKGKEEMQLLKQLHLRSSKLYKSCLELSLVTPLLAEAFINMMILILCKKEIRNNERQFDVFIRSPIDAKIFDLPYKCQGFAKPIDKSSDTFKNFKRVMDKRNHTIHGNINPENEKTEIVYFDGKRPLFQQSGDHIGKYYEMQEKQYQPNKVIKDYEDTHTFLISLAECLESDLAKGFWIVMSDNYPGYDLKRQITGAILPGHVVASYFQGIKYDDELAVDWAKYE